MRKNRQILKNSGLWKKVVGSSLALVASLAFGQENMSDEQINPNSYNPIPAFYTHLVAEDWDPANEDSMHLSDFKEVLNWLDMNGYKTLTYSELFEKIENHEWPLVEFPHKPILISFDESYEQHYTNVFQALKEHNFTATIAVQTDYINTPENLNQAQLLEM